jgi:hypothetical protein
MTGGSRRGGTVWHRTSGRDWTAPCGSPVPILIMGHGPGVTVSEHPLATDPLGTKITPTAGSTLDVQGAEKLPRTRGRSR